MSKSKFINYVLIGAISLVLLSSLLINVSVRSQEGQKNIQTGNPANVQSTQKEPDDATPIVDFENTKTTITGKSSLRNQRNARYNNSGFVVSQPTQSMGDVTMYSDPRTAITDLPVDESDAVVEGAVVSSAAFLSDDRTGVYSEFSIRISKVLKAKTDLAISDNEVIVAERFGGRVRYPSGKIVRYKVANEGTPVERKKYLFFLKQTAQGDYSIVTAYEIQGSQVFALDGSKFRVRGQGQTIFDRHNGKEFNVFMDEVEKVIQHSNSRNKP